MDEKTLTAVSTSLALFQIQLNALVLFLERQTSNTSIRQDFEQLVSDGVKALEAASEKGSCSRILKGWGWMKTAKVNSQFRTSERGERRTEERDIRNIGLLMAHLGHLP